MIRHYSFKDVALRTLQTFQEQKKNQKTNLKKKTNKQIEKIISDLTQWKIVWMVLKRQRQCSLANWNPLVDGTKWKIQVLRWHCSYFVFNFSQKKGGMTRNEKPLRWTKLTHQFNSWWWWWDINKSPWFSSGNCCLRLLFLYLKFIFEWKRRSCSVSVAVKIRKNWTR